MKLCEWTIIDSGGVKCGKPATRASNFRNSTKYEPVCEEHFQLDKRLKINAKK